MSPGTLEASTTDTTVEEDEEEGRVVLVEVTSGVEVVSAELAEAFGSVLAIWIAQLLCCARIFMRYLSVCAAW